MRGVLSKQSKALRLRWKRREVPTRMTFEIFLSRQAKRFHDKLDATTRDRIVEKVKLLAENPFAV